MVVPVKRGDLYNESFLGKANNFVEVSYWILEMVKYIEAEYVIKFI